MASFPPAREQRGSEDEFHDLSPDAIVSQLLGGKVPRPTPFVAVPWVVPLAEVAMRALAVDPNARWDGIDALRTQIENIARPHLASSDELAALVTGVPPGE